MQNANPVQETVAEVQNNGTRIVRVHDHDPILGFTETTVQIIVSGRRAAARAAYKPNGVDLVFEGVGVFKTFEMLFGTELKEAEHANLNCVCGCAVLTVLPFEGSGYTNTEDESDEVFATLFATDQSFWSRLFLATRAFIEGEHCFELVVEVEG